MLQKHGVTVIAEQVTEGCMDFLHMANSAPVARSLSRDSFVCQNAYFARRFGLDAKVN
jgi:hypothetical protein